MATPGCWMEIIWSTEWSLNLPSWEDLKFEHKGGSQQCRVPESAVVNISHGECLTLCNPDSLQAQFSSLQLLSRVWLCNPMNRSTPETAYVEPKRSKHFPKEYLSLQATKARPPCPGSCSTRWQTPLRRLGNFKAYSKETVFTDLRSGSQLHCPLHRDRRISCTPSPLGLVWGRGGEVGKGGSRTP